MKKYYTTIGLEVHAELSTKTKMFSNSPNDPFNAGPNQNVNPIDLAHPGTLPTINKKAVEHVIRVGLALGGTIANFTEFDRKNYFYPDIPKGYQISQYKYPIVKGGELAGVQVTRVHLEEDTANNKHHDNYSLIDFNRAGVPLMELVTEPCIHSSKQMGDFARELQTLLRYLGVSEANMEKGEMRVEVNLSVSSDPEKFGTKVEVKNIASFKMAEKAAEYEIKRHIELLEAGRGSEIVQETRGWDDVKQKTISQRAKENSNDYRYFPDPDLPKLYLHEIFDLEKMKGELPELPSQKRIRYSTDFGIKDEDIETYVSDSKLGDYFEEVVKGLGGDKEKIKTASNYVISDLMGLLKKDSTFEFPKPEKLVELVNLIGEGIISSRVAKDFLPELNSFSKSLKEIAEERGLIQKNDEGALKIIVEKICSENPEVVATYKGGKENAIMSLVGKVIKETQGSANPQVVMKLLKENLA
jgi:aspartyl-tRNA(Asn)/glutamyl-tRNA(Gln) amidotransferase subunit B